MFLDKRFWTFVVWNVGVYMYICLVGTERRDIGHGTFITAIDNIVFMMIMYAAIDLLPRAIRSAAKHSLVAMCMIVTAIQIFLIKELNTEIWYTVFHMVLVTSPNEAKEFIQFYSTRENIMVALAYVALCIGAILMRDFGFHIAKKITHTIAVITVVVITLLGVRDWVMYQNTHTIDRFKWRINIVNFIDHIFQAYQEISDYVAEYERFKEGISQNIKEAEYITANTSDIPNVVVIIGESVSRGFMGAYGYDLPPPPPVSNTPLIQKLVDSNNAFLFDNVAAPAASTSQSLKLVLTFSSYENNDIPWYKQMNLMDTMRLAGYKSIWLSNQETISVFDNAPNVIAKRSDHTFFTTVNNSISYKYDMELIHLYNKYKKHKFTLDGADKRFYVFHMAGSHIDYIKRYPHYDEKFYRFKKSDINMSLLKVKTEEDREKVVHYVNSIYYSDYIINGIYNLFRDEEAIIVYFSDHGNDVFQTANICGHRCSKYGLEIPFIVFVTDKFKQKHPDKVEDIKRAMHKRFMNDDFMHSFLPLIGIHTKDTVESKNIFSQNFDESRKRMTCGMDFDTDMLIENKSATGFPS